MRAMVCYASRSGRSASGGWKISVMMNCPCNVDGRSQRASENALALGVDDATGAERDGTGGATAICCIVVCAGCACCTVRAGAGIARR